jgi:signal transduction histidine kinase
MSKHIVSGEGLIYKETVIHSRITEKRMTVKDQLHTEYEQENRRAGFLKDLIPKNRLALTVSVVTGISAAILFTLMQLLSIHPAAAYCLCSIILAATVFSSIKILISRRAEQIIEAMKRTATGGIGSKININSRDEIGELAMGFNFMSLKLKRTFDKISDYNNRLEEIVKERTRDLVQAEKMASLGELVAGVSHEINTPLGICITAASHLSSRFSVITNEYRNGTMKRSALDDFIAESAESLALVLTNLERASELVNSFKQVAADRATQQRRIFNVKEYFEDILVSLKPKYKKTSHRVELTCPDDLEMDSYPGVYSQIISNMLLNALVHGLEGHEKGNILLDVLPAGDYCTIRFSDDGNGIEPSIIDRIFEPFFTTKRGQGGIGLGLNIVHNLVTQTLGGTIRCESTPGKGAAFFLTVPINVPKESQS